MLDAPPTPPLSVAASSSAKNAHLKGRKRFAADFADLKAQGLELGGLAVTKIQKGDDEGMLDLVVVDRNKNDARVLGCNITITDTSEYPKHHTILTYSDDTDLPERVTRAFSGLESAPAMPIGEALERLLTSLSGAKPAAAPKSPTKPLTKGKSFATNNAASDEELDSDEGSDDYDGYFSDNDYAIPNNSQARTTAAAAKERVTARIQRDFVEVVSSSYRPGLIPFTSGQWDPATDFAVSVSFPTVQLTQTIPAQALVAWDRRLLASAKARYLVLLISGFNSGAGSSVHNVYPPLTAEGQYVRKGMQLRFQVGVCSAYKPTREHAVEAGRTFGLVGKDAEDEIREAREKAAKLREAQLAEWGSLDPDGEGPGGDGGFGDFGGAEFGEDVVEDGGQDDEEGRFERFSLSSSLEALLDSQLVRLIALRRQYGIGWAGAEMMVERVEREQRAEAEVWTVYRQEILAADADEAREARGGTLPHDPLHALPKGDDINVPYVAFCYLVRRLTLCTRYCLVCHNKLNTEFEALKPYVCDRPLCTYQYYAHNRGASLEYEIIHNPETVDLLLSLTYSAAAEGAVDEPLPVGMALRVPPPDKARITIPPPSNIHAYHQPAAPAPAPTNFVYAIGNDGLVDFDTLPVEHMRASIAGLIDTLPSIDDMKRHLERKVKPGKSKPRLKEMENGTILPAAWSILRWCVASCTAYLEEMSSEEQCIQGLDPAWRQFRFSVGAPDAEAKFQKAQQKSTATDPNAKKYPSIYAFHGSALRNWHSIIRHGLWFKIVANGRAYGDGVYLAKEAQTSMSHYAASARACWRKSKLGPTSCMALAELVNLPHQFVSSSPHYVIKDTEWIMCRYLLVKGLDTPQADALRKKKKDKAAIPFVKLDPAQTTTLMGKALQVPQPGHQIAQLVEERTQELVDEDHDETDAYIFADRAPPQTEVIELSDDDEPMPMPMPAAKGKGKGKGASLGPPKDDWKHDAAYVQRTVEMLMPPPLDSTPSSTMAVQRELKAMLKEQDKAMVSPGGLKELGWYMPPELVGDNLFQWIVEMHSFDETLPIAQDMKKQKVNSLIFEIRFGPTYPIGPPFFRIITPRFLPFMHGGGGHVTGGGSICMDLLTSDGWLPSYSISAVLMQIKLAISNLDPKPARLAHNWNTPYGVGEALAGFKRAAATHNWTVSIGFLFALNCVLIRLFQVPDGFDKLVR
ncbi:hypothetical protein B0H16DRAFT_1311189 [Mycena metata]|uniref:UBC core domain-containing protein n=1 Tax=Mycena metata TaxID=1033252 RepID=A0AAD7NJ61_9AGAR|nr:hypothetical protein B0H16DRAFT_1311189 [Mycena metata]